MADGVLEITQVKSGVHCPLKQRQALVGLGLRKMNKTVLRKNTPEIWGMIHKITHLVAVKER
jgi:large subunit ribosomal protein L30